MRCELFHPLRRPLCRSVCSGDSSEKQHSLLHPTCSWMFHHLRFTPDPSTSPPSPEEDSPSKSSAILCSIWPSASSLSAEEHRGDASCQQLGSETVRQRVILQLQSVSAIQALLTLSNNETSNCRSGCDSIIAASAVSESKARKGNIFVWPG